MTDPKPDMTTPGFKRRTKSLESAVKYHREMMELAVQDLALDPESDPPTIERRNALERYIQAVAHEAAQLAKRYELTLVDIRR